MTTNTLGSDPAFRPKATTAWLLPFAPMGVAAFSLSALVFYHVRHDAFDVRSALQHAYAALYRAVGFAPAVMFFGLVLLWSTIWLANGSLQRPLQRLGRLAAMAIMLGVLLNLGDGDVSPALHKGAIGAAVAQALVSAVGYWPSLVLVWAMTFASLLLATDFFFQESFERLLAAPRGDAEPEAGVESGAAERLRESGHAVAAVADTSAAPAFDAPLTVAAAADAEPSRRRRSYEERRAEREAMASRWSAYAAVPAMAESSAPESAPADPYELSAARVVDAIDAAADDASSAVEGDVPEALQRDGADDGYPTSLARVQRTPIVFPDEAPTAPAAEAASAPTEAALPDDGWPAAPAPTDVSAGGESSEASSPVEEPAVAADAAEPAAIVAPVEAGVRDVADEVDGLDVADDDALGLGDEVIVLADPNDAGFSASFASASEGGDDGDDDSAQPFATAAYAADGASEAPVAAEPVEAAPIAEAEVAPAPVEAEIAIPRPDVAATPARAPSGLDEALVAEAIDLVTTSRRANTVFLQRKLRIDYDVAAAVLAELAARGVVALDAEATHGRVLA